MYFLLPFANTLYTKSLLIWSHAKFYEHISNTKVSQVKISSDYLRLMLKFKEKIRVLLDIIMNGKEINSTDSETECTSVEDPLNM